MTFRIIAVFILLSFLLSGYKSDVNVLPVNAGANTTFSKTIKLCDDTLRSYFLGVDATNLYVSERQFTRRDNLAKIFAENNLDKKAYKQFVKLTKDIPGFSGIRSKDKYYTLSNVQGEDSSIQYLAYKMDAADYLIVDFRNDLDVYVYEKQVDTIVEQYAMVLEKSLSKTFKEKNISPALIEKLDKAFQNKISMSKLKKGDTIRFIYDALYVDGDFYDYSNIHAASVQCSKGQFLIADYYIDSDSSYQYVDESGKYLKSSFLKAPVKKGSIVSRYNLHRFHPILQEVKAHLGTDFAAPKGTPILATASGVVEAATFTQNNGYFVKIRHDKVYETQYLHMCRFAKGIHKGTRVQQGQVIGYVGSTGMATGPHVCYRFWKHGVQVDPLKEKLNVVKLLAESDMQDFQYYFASVRKKLDNLSLN